MKTISVSEMVSMKFATFPFLFQLIWVIFGHFMFIWSPRLKTEFRRILEKSLGRNGLKSNLKSTFFPKNLLKTYFSSNFRPENIGFEEKFDFEDSV